MSRSQSQARNIKLTVVGLLVVIWYGREFLNATSIEQGMTPLIIMSVIALLFGIHMVMAIGVEALIVSAALLETVLRQRQTSSQGWLEVAHMEGPTAMMLAVECGHGCGSTDGVWVCGKIGHVSLALSQTLTTRSIDSSSMLSTSFG